MEKKKNTIDGLEVFIKVKMGIELTDEEANIYDSYAEDEKKIIFDFINNSAFSDDLNRLTKKIEMHTENTHSIQKDR